MIKENALLINDVAVKAGLSHVALSRQSGVPYKTIQRFCNAKRLPLSIQALVMLAKSLNVTVDSLIK